MLFYACYGLLGANTPAAMRWNTVPEKICFSYAVFSTGVPQVLGVGEHIWVNAEAEWKCSKNYIFKENKQHV